MLYILYGSPTDVMYQIEIVLLNSSEFQSPTSPSYFLKRLAELRANRALEIIVNRGKILQLLLRDNEIFSHIYSLVWFRERSDNIL